jgi:RNA polymerase sigma-70 factor (ECF subfamily)
MAWKHSGSEDSYHSCVAQFGAALERLAFAYEADPDLRRDLLQEVHTALWRSLGIFDGRCSLRTWTFRVAHNTAASHVARNRKHNARDWVTLETIEQLGDGDNNEDLTNRRLVIDRVAALIQKLRPFDRQMFLLYLEGLDATSIAEIIGISQGNVTTKIYRIKRILVQQFQEGENNNERRSIRGRRSRGMAEPGAGNDAVDVELASPHRSPV